MKIMLTMTIQKTVEVTNEDAYEATRDALVAELENRGFTVDVEDETELEGPS